MYSLHSLKVVRSHLQVFRVTEKKASLEDKGTRFNPEQSCGAWERWIGRCGSRPRAGTICDPLSLNCTFYILKMREMGISGKYGLSNPLPLPIAAKLQKSSPGQDGKAQRAKQRPRYQVSKAGDKLCAWPIQRGAAAADCTDGILWAQSELRDICYLSKHFVQKFLPSLRRC